MQKCLLLSLLAALAVLDSCTTMPTLVSLARRRQANKQSENKRTTAYDEDVTVKYSVTDMDVLNFTDEVKKHLDRRASIHTNIRYGSATTMATLGALAGAAKTLGWSTSTASGLGLGATFIFGMGQIFDSKGHALAYEQSLAAVQSAESGYFFQQLGLSFDRIDGKNVVNRSKATNRSGVPSAEELTPAGEALYYRVTKILNVLSDTLAGKIPDLQDLKEAHGESRSTGSSFGPSASNSSNSGGGNGSNSSPQSSVIPAHLQVRNSLLETSFKKLTEEDAKQKLLAKGEKAPEDSTSIEHLARAILAKASLPIPPGKTALQGLTFYRSNAVDDSTTSKLEAAYKHYGVL